MFEIAWAAALKASNGMTRPWWVACMVVSLIFSAVLLGISLKWVPLSTAYAVWTGIGAAGTAVVGMMVFGEPRDWPRVVCLGLILAGIVGLQLVSGATR